MIREGERNKGSGQYDDRRLYCHLTGKWAAPEVHCGNWPRGAKMLNRGLWLSAVKVLEWTNWTAASIQNYQQPQTVRVKYSGHSNLYYSLYYTLIHCGSEKRACIHIFMVNILDLNRINDHLLVCKCPLKHSHFESKGLTVPIALSCFILYFI